MLYISIISFFVFLLLMIYLVFRKMMGNRLKIEKRLEFIENIEKLQYTEEDLTFGERVIIPMFNRIGKRFLDLSPEYINKKKRMVLERAGFLKNTSYERFVARRMLMSIVATLFVGLIGGVLKINIILNVFLMVWMFAFIQIMYRFMTKSAIKNRGLKMVRDLPYTLDLITISVEAGL